MEQSLFTNIWLLHSVQVIRHFMHSQLIAQSCPFLLRSHGLQPAKLLCSWEFPGKNAGLVAISSSRGSTLFQEILPTQGLNLHLLYLLQVDSFTTEPPGKPHGHFNYYQTKKETFPLMINHLGLCKHQRRPLRHLFSKGS